MRYRLSIKTPKGGVLVVGCSHPGIERFVETAVKIDPSCIPFSADSISSIFPTPR